MDRNLQKGKAKGEEIEEAIGRVSSNVEPTLFRPISDFAGMSYYERFKVFFAYNSKISQGTSRPYAFLLSWLLSRISLRCPTPWKTIKVPTRVNQREIILPVRLNTTDTFVVKEIYGDHQYLCNEMPHKVSRILDLGANAGFATLFFAALYPHAAIACVEPLPENIKALKFNLATNGISATIIEGAVGDSARSRGFVCDGTPASGHLGHDKHGEIQVETFSLRDVLKKLGWESVDLVKIDIEGAEFELIKSDLEVFRIFSCIFIELHDWIPKSEVVAALHSIGFVGQVIHSEQGGEVLFLRKA